MVAPLRSIGMQHRAGQWTLVAALLTGLVAGCSSNGDGGDEHGEASTSSPTVSATPQRTGDSAFDLGLPDTPTGHQLAWVLSVAATATTDDVVAHFSPTFLAAVSADQVIPILQQMGTVRVLSTTKADATTLIALVEGDDGMTAQATIVVEPTEPHRIVGLQFTPADPPESPTTWADVDTRLDALAATTSLIAAEVADDASFVVAHERAADQPRAIGSAFKLYVLGMLTDRIAGGDLSWDDELTITAATKSFPPGQLQNRPGGSTVTIREAAELMISISDNTATDLLIDAIGRQQIEQILPAMGLGEDSQARTLPLLKTREFFILKWATDPAERDAYTAAGVEQRRRILATLPAELPSIDLFDPTTPTAIDEIEWFASAAELARAQLWVDSQRGLPGLEPLEQVLEANPGIDLDPAVWTRYSFKGGSEPGVVTMSWLLTRADGKRFVVSLIANDDSDAVDELDAASIAAGVVNLLATT